MAHQEAFTIATAAGFVMLVNAGISKLIFGSASRADFEQQQAGRGRWTQARLDYFTMKPFAILGAILFPIGVIGMVLKL